MTKNIVLCSDGTGNSAGKGRGTNVAKIHEAVDLDGHRRDTSLPLQLALHDDGVGTESLKPLRLLGGAFGWGLARNVRELYTALCRWYEVGDDIYLFGFSRGAFTVRTLAGLIVDCGIIRRDRWKTDRELQRLVREAYASHRKHYPTLLSRAARALIGSGGEDPAQSFRRKHGVEHPDLAPEGRVPIRFVGVWDTVAALGFPIAHVADFWNMLVYRFKFHDGKVSKQVGKACQALSIDEERDTFHPELWSEEGEKDDRVEQVWFAGVHSNVGGGYPKHGMSLVPLHWMMLKAQDAGLRFSPGALENYRDRQNVDDKLYDSRRGLAVYYRYKPRKLAELCDERKAAVRIHYSVFERIARATDAYAPGGIPGKFEIAGDRAAGSAGAPKFPGAKALQERVAGALKAAELDLGRATKWVWLRRSLHHLFLALNFAVIWLGRSYVAAPGSPDDSTVGATAARWVSWAVPVVGGWLGENLVQPILSDSVVGAAVVLTALLFYGLSRFARARIKSIHSAFWRQTLGTADSHGSPAAAAALRSAPAGGT